MSVYTDMAEKAARARSYKRPEQSLLTAGAIYNNPLFLKNEITQEVLNEIERRIISEQEIINVCDRLHQFIVEDYKNIDIRMQIIKNNLNKEVLSLNGNTFEECFDNTSRTFNSRIDLILEFESQVRARINTVRDFQRNNLIWNYYNTGKYLEQYKG